MNIINADVVISEIDAKQVTATLTTEKVAMAIRRAANMARRVRTERKAVRAAIKVQK